MRRERKEEKGKCDNEELTKEKGGEGKETKRERNWSRMTEKNQRKKKREKEGEKKVRRM